MENNFLEAFEKSNTLQELFNSAKGQVNKQNAANAKKQNAANASADLANENGYQLIIAALQKIANEQVQFDEKSINEYITNINNLKSLDDKSKKQINQILNQQKAALQQQAAADKSATDGENSSVDDTNKTQKVDDKTITSGEVPSDADSTENKGDPKKVEKNVGVVNGIDGWFKGPNPMFSVDDLIAYLQDLKKKQQT